MPKQSKVKSTPPATSKKTKAVEETMRRQSEFYCTRCTRHFQAQKKNFPISHSQIYKENNGYLPVCIFCFDDMFRYYRGKLGNERDAMRRLCSKFDIYWSDHLFDLSIPQGTRANRSPYQVTNYLTRTNLGPYMTKTYDDTLDDEMSVADGGAGAIPPMRVSENQEANGSDEVAETGLDEEEISVPEEVLNFWGDGLSADFYPSLEKRFSYWLGDIPVEERSSRIDNGECALIKQICMLEVTINRDSKRGADISKSINVLNALLGSANMKPVQKKNDGEAGVEMTPFGVWIRKIEDTRPIPEPSPEFRDVDGIAKYISVWFLGHLCKMLKISNSYSALYEEEIAKLKVERPEYDGEDDEGIIEDIFSRAEKAEQAAERAEMAAMEAGDPLDS